MPPLPDVPNVIRFRPQFTISGKTNQGLRWFCLYSGGPPAVSDLEAFAATADAAAIEYLCPQLHDSSAFTGHIIEDLSSDTGAVYTSTQDTTGALSADPAPSNAAFVVSYGIARRYRGGHPRGYWPLGDASKLDGNSAWSSGWVATALTAVTDYLAAAYTGSSGSTTLEGQKAVSFYSGFTSVQNPITKRYRNVPTLLEVPVVYPINSWIGRSYIGSTRKRRPKTSIS